MLKLPDFMCKTFSHVMKLVLELCDSVHLDSKWSRTRYTVRDSRGWLKATMKTFQVFLLVSLAWTASAFVAHNMPLKTSRMLRATNLCLANLKATEGTPGQADWKKALAQGFFAGLLLASPGLDLIHHSTFSDGGLAYAQGATSSKSTRAAPSVDANKDPESILRFSLPIANNKNIIREAQVLSLC
jgi:hypothetical protein